MVLLADGNLVLYDFFQSEELWSSETHYSGAIAANMRDDGNFVLFTAKGGWTWTTDTYITFWPGDLITFHMIF